MLLRADEAWHEESSMQPFLLAVVGSAFLESGYHMTTDSPHRGLLGLVVFLGHLILSVSLEACFLVSPANTPALRKHAIRWNFRSLWLCACWLLKALRKTLVVASGQTIRRMTKGFLP